MLPRITSEHRYDSGQPAANAGGGRTASQLSINVSPRIRPSDRFKGLVTNHIHQSIEHPPSICGELGIVTLRVGVQVELQCIAQPYLNPSCQQLRRFPLSRSEVLHRVGLRALIFIFHCVIWPFAIQEVEEHLDDRGVILRRLIGEPPITEERHGVGPESLG